MNIDKLAFRKNAIRVGLASFLAGGIGFSQTTASETAAKTETELPEITVSAHLANIPYDQTGVSVTKLNPAQLEKEGIHDLSTALAHSPGVYILPGGDVNQRGSIAKPTIRGMSQADYNLTMVDGIRLNGVGTNAGCTLIGMSDLFSFGNIEVLRGSQGAIYGSTAIGGVVNMDTPDGQGEPSVRIFTEAGSFNSIRSSVVAQGEIKKLSYFVGVGYEQTDNDPSFPSYLGDNNNNKFEQWSEIVKLGYQVNDKVRISGTFRHQDAKMEDPAFLYWLPDKTSYHNENRTRLTLGSGKIEAELTRKWTTSLMAGFYQQDYSNLYPDVAEQNYAGQDFFNQWKKVQIEWRNLLTWNEQNKTTMGFAWDRSTFETANQPIELENVYALFAEHMYSPIKGLDLSIAGRLEESNIWDNYGTWRASASWKVRGEHSKTRILGSIGSGFRAPSAWERKADYTNWTGTYVGNPDLGISKSLGGDLGVEQKIAKNHSVTVSAFWIRVNNQIVPTYGWYPTPNSWDNAAYATSYGLETAFRGDFKDAWNSGYTVAYTYTLPETSDKKQLVFTARNVFSADIHTSPIASVTTGFGLEAATARTGSVNQRLDNYAIIRWYARWQANKNLALHVRVENMSNQRYAVQDFGYPTLSQGLSIQGGVTLTF